MTTVVHVREEGGKTETKEKKGLMSWLPAEGSCLDKIVFVILGIIALAIFVSSIAANVASSKPVSSVTFKAREEFPFPGVFFCNEWESRMTPVSGDAQGSDQYSAQEDSDGNVCVGIRGTRSNTCFEWDAGAGGVSYRLPDFDPPKYDPGYFEERGEEPPLLPDWNNQDDSEDGLERARAISDWFKAERGWAAGRCYVANSDGQLSIPKGGETSHMIGARLCPTPGTPTFVVGGMFDPSLPVDRMFDAGFSYYFFSGYNSLSELVFTMDLETDLSEESGGFSPKKAEDYPEMTHRVWHQSFSTGAVVGRMDEHELDNGDVTACGSMSMLFDVGSFMGRDVLTRNKALSETLAEIGGAWATSALILAVFFKPIILHVVEGQPSKNKQMARWRKELPVAGEP